MSNDDRGKLKTLERDLKSVVVGQDKALDVLASAVKMARSGLGKDDKPIGSFLFSGPTGVGKTGLACGILLKALENGYRCQFVRAQDLFDEMYASLAARSSRQLLKRLARLDVLHIDEFGYLNPKPEQSNHFFKPRDAP